MTPHPSGSSGPIVILGRDNDATAIVFHYLAERFDTIVTVVESPIPAFKLMRQRARRLGWRRVAGQMAFVTIALPVLHRRGLPRIRSILADAGVNPDLVTDVHRVASVNAPETVSLLRELSPSVVVVIGTRIISRTVLDAVDSPFVNTHAGITPRYRGMNGAYWALAEGRPEMVGTTVHLVDPGIDTGTVLAQTHFTPTAEDSIATYFYLHLVSGLPALAEQVAILTGGGAGTRSTGPTPAPQPPSTSPSTPSSAAGPGPGPKPDSSQSKLWGHPTLWEYLTLRWRTGLR